MSAVASATLIQGNKFSRNRIFNNNNLLGIDLHADRVSSNDDGDGDDGANGLLNFPVITSVVVNSGNLIIQGFSRPNSVIEFYIADAGPNPNPLPGGYTTDFGEGQTFCSVVRTMPHWMHPMPSLAALAPTRLHRKAPEPVVPAPKQGSASLSQQPAFPQQ